MLNNQQIPRQKMRVNLTEQHKQRNYHYKLRQSTGVLLPATSKLNIQYCCIQSYSLSCNSCGTARLNLGKETNRWWLTVTANILNSENLQKTSKYQQWLNMLTMLRVRTIITFFYILLQFTNWLQEELARNLYKCIPTKKCIFNWFIKMFQDSLY